MPTVSTQSSSQSSAHAPGFVFNPEIASMIGQLWEDSIMDQVMDRFSEFYLMDSSP